MMTRPYKPSDAAFVARIHAERGFPGDAPDLSSPEWESVRVGVDGDDRPVMVVGARRTVEVILWADAEWQTPGIRLNLLTWLHWAMFEILKSRGYKSAHAWLEPSIARAFGSRLRRTFGWQESPWQSWEVGWGK